MNHASSRYDDGDDEQQQHPHVVLVSSILSAQSHFEVLQVRNPQVVSDDDIRKAYKHLALRTQ